MIKPRIALSRTKNLRNIHLGAALRTIPKETHVIMPLVIKEHPSEEKIELIHYWDKAELLIGRKHLDDDLLSMLKIATNRSIRNSSADISTVKDLYDFIYDMGLSNMFKKIRFARLIVGGKPAVYHINDDSLLLTCYGS